MIGLDTNVLVRLVVHDDLRQAEAAKRFLSRHCTPESPGFIASIVLAEFAWVLAVSYGYGRSDIAAATEGLLIGGDRIVEHHDAVRASLEDYKKGQVDFVDALMARVNPAYGSEVTATLDRKATRLDGFVQVA